VKKYYPAQFTPLPDRKAVPKEVFDAWPPRSHVALYGSGPVAPADVEKLLKNFAARA